MYLQTGIDTMQPSTPLLPAFTQSRRLDTRALEGKVLCVDALALLAMLPDNSVDMVLCDLPYGGVIAASWDVIIPFDKLWEQLRRIVKKRGAIALTATEPFASRLRVSAMDLYKYDWQWDKVRPSGMTLAKTRPMQQIEYVLIFSKGTIATGSPNNMNYFPIKTKRDKPISGKVYSNSPSSKLWALNNNHLRIYDDKYPVSLLRFQPDASRLHPTQKPVALFEYLIRTYTQPNDLVIDMTCGSGTTALAARKTGRRFICGDNSPEYAALANTRLQNTDAYQPTVFADGTKQLSLFAQLEVSA
jgi:site-specific DNA-methyltransferase (adenine-specific)